MVDNTIRTDIYVLSGGIGASVTPDKCTPRKKYEIYCNAASKKGSDSK